jgi:DNA-binding response OmpR family regulator
VAPKAHVLIVEDSELVTGAMRVLFEAADRRVSVAASVAEALDVGTHDPADLVLLDLTLPDGDGLTIIEPLKAVGTRHFIALTGRDEKDVLTRCREAGCAEVLVKPVPVRELIAKTEGWLG